MVIIARLDMNVKCSTQFSIPDKFFFPLSVNLENVISEEQVLNSITASKSKVLGGGLKLRETFADLA